MSTTVHLLWFVQENEVRGDTELLIGVYDSEADAKAAIDRLKNKPGFIDFQEGFQIHRRELGQDSWTEGFVQSS
jgi:homoserine kinase type II